MSRGLRVETRRGPVNFDATNWRVEPDGTLLLDEGLGARRAQLAAGEWLWVQAPWRNEDGS